MPNIPVVSAQKLIRILKKKHFILQRIHGSHHILINKDNKTTISVPVHKGRDLGRGITHTILKDAGISPGEFCRLC